MHASWAGNFFFFFFFGSADPRIFEDSNGSSADPDQSGFRWIRFTPTYEYEMNPHRDHRGREGRRKGRCSSQINVINVAAKANHISHAECFVHSNVYLHPITFAIPFTDNIGLPGCGAGSGYTVVQCGLFFGQAPPRRTGSISPVSADDSFEPGSNTRSHGRGVDTRRSNAGWGVGWGSFSPAPFHDAGPGFISPG